MLVNGKVMPTPPTTFAIVDAIGSNMQIRNIKIDGNRANNAYYGHSPLIRIIGGSGNLIDNVRMEHTLGFVALDAADGASCSYLTITNNYIGDNGGHIPGYAGQWADGLTLRCNSAYVANNQIRDATDGGITFFGGTNTIIESNWVANSGKSAFSGILVDPVMGYAGMTFTGTQVRYNLIETCCGQHIHVAVGAGTHLWCNGSNGNCNYANGPSILNNSVNGTFGYGLYLGGVVGATATGNNVSMTSFNTMICPSASYVMDVDASAPYAPHATGTFQSGYTTASLHWPCMVDLSE